MSSERLRPGEIESRRRRALARYVRYEVHPYSALNRRRLDDAGVGAGVGDVEALARVPPIGLAEVDDPTSLVLRPTVTSILKSGDLTLRMRVLWGRTLDRAAWLNDHVIGPTYKPVQWTEADGLLIGWSSDDLDRLADLGRRWLTMAGVRGRDTLLSLMPMAPTLEVWETVLGARAAGLSAAHLGPGGLDAVERIGPTVVVGRLADLMAAALPADGSIRRLLVIDGVPDDDARDELAARAGGGATVLAAWAPDGARALWAECRPGSGLHTWPDTEVVQTVDGELVWSPIGWRGSVVMRLRTGVGGALDPTPCRACGRTTPRVVVEAPA